MKFLSIAALTGLVAAVAAAPGNKWQQPGCLTDAKFQQLIANFIVFLEHTNVAVANATAQATFSPSIMEVGDSINSLRGDPLGTVVSSNSSQYIGDELSSPPIPNVSTVDSFHTCDRFLWYWEFDGLGTGEYRVRGATIGTYDTQTGLVSHQVVEFNSLAWAADTGYTITPPANYPGKRSVQF